MIKGFRVVGILALLVIAGRADAATLTPIWQFSGGGTDGAQPEGGMVQGFDGSFYGTTSAGTPDGFGTVFKITSAGALTTLWQFTDGTDGGAPAAALIQGSDSNFYGTAIEGGSNDVGVVFKITSAGTLTTLWQFSGGTDGGSPQAGLVQGLDGNFYGTTSAGGSNDFGTVYSITSAGTLTTLWQFSGGADGGEPDAEVVQGLDSNFYGTTFAGGTNSGFGTVFQITSAGTLTTLHRFLGGADGSEPEAKLVLGSDTNFYGTTFSGGLSGHGTVFKISPSGTFSNVYRFTGGADGDNPQAPLVLGTDGLFYGTTSDGGTNSFGNVFRISSSGVLSNLWQFGGGADGSFPFSGLTLGTDGLFYGTTFAGGTNASGGVFKLSLAGGGGGGTNTTLTQITLIQVVGNDIVVTIPSIVGQNYQLQFSEQMNPTNWTNVAGASQGGTGSPIQLTEVGGALHPHRFYRVDISGSGSSGNPSTAQISSITISGNDVILTINSVTGSMYQLQSTDSLTPANWTNSGPSQPGNNGVLTFTDTGGALVPNRNYRIVISS